MLRNLHEASVCAYLEDDGCTLAIQRLRLGPIETLLRHLLPDKMTHAAPFVLSRCHINSHVGVCHRAVDRRYTATLIEHRMVLCRW